MSLSLTVRQIDLMKQALRDGNNYHTSPHHDAWNDLCYKNFSDKTFVVPGGKATFRVTAKGREALAKFN